MAGLDIKKMDTPDEKRQFVDKGHANFVDLDGTAVLKGTFEPGWRWSEHVKPIAQTDSCQAPHLLYVLSGRMKIVMEDGTEARSAPAMPLTSRPDTMRGRWVTRRASPLTSAAPRTTRRSSKPQIPAALFVRGPCSTR